MNLKAMRLIFLHCHEGFVVCTATKFVIIHHAWIIISEYLAITTTQQPSNFIANYVLSLMEHKMPSFQFSICGRKIKGEYEVSCTGDVKRNVNKAPWCCGKQMIEGIID
jgi:hypothetical protein